MSGLSDVRLILRSQELAAEQKRVVRVDNTPYGLSRWALFWHRRHTRKALLELTPAQLRDVGLSAEQAYREGLKPFWRS